MSTNPYEASGLPNSPYDSPEPVVNKPASIIIFGILNLVFAIFGLFSSIGGIGLLILAYNAQGGQNSPWEALWIQNSGQAVFMIATGVLGFIFTIVQLFAGIGLLRGRKSGRTLSIVYAWYAIISAVAGAAISYFLFLPPVIAQQPNATVFIVISIVSTLGSLIFPVLLLIFMYRRNVAAALN